MDQRQKENGRSQKTYKDLLVQQVLQASRVVMERMDLMQRVELLMQMLLAQLDHKESVG
jgi:hypothetical protein